MANISRSITIQAPIERVFAYVTDPMSLTEWMVGMMDVSDVNGSGADLHFQWRYKMAGIPLNGETKFTEYVPNERSASESKGGIPQDAFVGRTHRKPTGRSWTWRSRTPFRFRS